MTILSVIIPFYDETAFLESAIRSARSQRIAGLEILVINDNPAVFNSQDIRESGAFGDDVSILTHAENRGLSAARNTGIDAARGQYIGFLDADDYYLQDGLSAQLAMAQESGADITHGAALLSNPGSPKATLLERDEKLHMQKRVKSGLRNSIEAQFIVSSWSSLYARAFLKQFNLRFDEDQTSFEDRLFVLHSVSAARKIAFLGEPVRVWRRRAGSITSSPRTAKTHVLQVQLLEKCMLHMRGLVSSKALPQRFEKCELFNCVSRLIWDMDILSFLANPPKDADDRSISLDLQSRITALLGKDSFSHAIFSDPMVQKTSRVGMNSLKGRITREDFFTLHKDFRDGAFSKAAALVERRMAEATRRAERKRVPLKLPTLPIRLVLHLGMHKTGSTYLQHQMRAHRDSFLEKGVLIPKSGEASHEQSTRIGGYAGHHGLLRALHENDIVPWQNLWKEAKHSKAHTVVISCENMLLPTHPNRESVIAQLMDRFTKFEQVDVIALARRADEYIEEFYKERVCAGRRDGARDIHEFLVDYQDALTDLPTLFAPFENATASNIRLGDFELMRTDGHLWKQFCELVEIPNDLPPSDVPQYPSVSRESTELIRLVNTLVKDRDHRQQIIRGYFSMPSENQSVQSLLAPCRRADLLASFEALSLDFAASRGYLPDLKKMATELGDEAWKPVAAINQSELSQLIQAGLQTPSLLIGGNEVAPMHNQHSTAHNSSVLTIRVRPWVRNVLNWMSSK